MYSETGLRFTLLAESARLVHVLERLTRRYLMTAPIDKNSGSDDLLAAVQELTISVQGLAERLNKEYPKRDEVRSEGRKRAIRTLVFGVVLIVIAQVLGVGTTSYCFLARDFKGRTGCNLLPGYSGYQDDVTRRIEFLDQQMIDVQLNRERILHIEDNVIKLENQIEKLEARN
jgi:hypothetical protein